MEFIPIAGDVPSIGYLPPNSTIDTRYGISGIDDVRTRLGIGSNTISFRDIVRLYAYFLKRSRWYEVIHGQRYKQLNELGSTYPINYLLFDFCLALLDDDVVDAKLYLAHCNHILGLDRSFALVLSAVVNASLQKDPDVLEMLVCLSKASEPRNASSYLNTLGEGFRKRYEIYSRERERLSL